MLRVGTVPYLVARPLTWGLEERADVELVAAPPSELARGLAAGELDVALASSILAVEDPRYRLWEQGPVIASRGPVRSVLLLLRPGLVDPSGVRRVGLDPHSRTGRVLATSILRDRWRADFEAVELAGDDQDFAAGVDAVQRIGDPALLATAERPDWRPVDLGAEWFELTGLPFVFAGWVGRPGFDPARAAEVLEPAATAGLGRRRQFAAAADLPGLESSFLEDYLLRDIRYRLPAAEVRAAMAEFGRRVRQPVKG